MSFVVETLIIFIFVYLGLAFEIISSEKPLLFHIVIFAVIFIVSLFLNILQLINSPCGKNAKFTLGKHFIVALFGILGAVTYSDINGSVNYKHYVTSINNNLSCELILSIFIGFSILFGNTFFYISEAK